MDYRVIDGSHFHKSTTASSAVGMVYMSSHSFRQFDRGIISKYIRNPTKPLESESDRVLSEKQLVSKFTRNAFCRETETVYQTTGTLSNWAFTW